MPSPKTLREMITRVLPGIPDEEIGLVLDFANKLRADTRGWAEPAKKFLSKREPCWPSSPGTTRRPDRSTGQYRHPVRGQRVVSAR